MKRGVGKVIYYRKAKREYRRLCEEKKDKENDKWMVELRGVKMEQQV